MRRRRRASSCGTEGPCSLSLPSDKTCHEHSSLIITTIKCSLKALHQVLLNGTYDKKPFWPGESLQVNLVCVDEAHVLKHAEHALQTHTTGSVTSLLFCVSVSSILHLISLPVPLSPSLLTLSSYSLWVWCHRAGSAACRWTRRSRDGSLSLVRSPSPAP